MGGRFANPSHLLITGASSGIGAALAREYAAPGRRLVLGGRDGARLAAVAESCRDQGAEVETACLDVRDEAAMARWIEGEDARRPLDLVIANAGVSAGTGSLGAETPKQARLIHAVNVEGVMNTVFPAVELLRPRGAGQIALMSSLAGFRGFPGAPAYCASKAMVRIWGEALRGHLAPAGVGVSVICPGYVESPMTAVNDFPMPCLMSAEKAARIVRRGLAHDRGRIAFPFPTYFVAWLLGSLSPGVTDGLLRRLPEKG